MGRVLVNSERIEFERAVRRSLQETVKKLRQERPEFARFNLSATVRASRKRPKGFSNYQERLVELMVNSPSLLAKTNSEIVAHLARSFPGYTPSESIMYVKLYPKSKERIQSILRRNELPIQVTSKDTLSSIKRAIRAKRGAANNSRAYMATIEFSDDSVVVGSRPYPIDKSRKHPSIRVESNGRSYLRCDQLEAILQQS